MGTVRAKFRVMSTTQQWDGWASAKLQPIIPGASGEPSPENDAFWKYTPGGDADVRNDDGQFVAGQAVYIDIEADKAGGWICKVVSHEDGDTGEVTLRKRNSSDHVRLWIDNPSAVAQFTAGQRYAVTFSPAPLGEPG